MAAKRGWNDINKRFICKCALAIYRGKLKMRTINETTIFKSGNVTSLGKDISVHQNEGYTSISVHGFSWREIKELAKRFNVEIRELSHTDGKRFLTISISNYPTVIEFFSIDK